MSDTTLDNADFPASEVDSELALLEGVYASVREGKESVTQRGLAEDAGLSLGMTNLLLKRCVERGWIMIRRANARRLQYVLTGEGINEIARRTYRYFRRASRSVSLYRDLIEAFVMARKRAGCARVVLAGPSDLDFLLEYACERHGLLFARTGDIDLAARMAGTIDMCVVVGERVDSGLAMHPEATALREVLLGRR